MKNSIYVAMVLILGLPSLALAADNILMNNVGIGSTVPQARLEVGTGTSIVTGSSPAVAVKNNVVVDGNIYGTEFNMGANATIKYNSGTSSIDFIVN